MILESAFSHEPHEYLRDTLDLKYRKCNSCANRIEFTCIKCGFCWSCHWKMEQAEKFELFDRSMWIDRLAPSFSSYSHSMTVKDRGKEKEKKEQHLSKEISNYQITTKAIDYSVKRCKHPQNDVIGA